MAAFLPIALALGNLLAREVGAAATVAMVPILIRIANQLELMGKSGVFQASFMKVAESIGGLQYVGLQVYVINPDLIDNIAATRWAVTYFSYVTALKQVEYLWLIHLDLLAILDALRGLASFTQVIAQLQAVSAVSLQIALVIEAPGGLADFFNKLDLWKLIGLLAIILVFVALLGLALRTFSSDALLAVLALGGVALIMSLLIGALSSYNWEQIGRIAALLGMIVVFVALLGAALNTFTKNAIIGVLAVAAIALVMYLLIRALSAYDWDQIGRIGAALAAVTLFIYILSKILTGYSWGDLGKIGLGLGEFALFLVLLGLALKLFTEESIKAIPAIIQLLDSILGLAKAITGFKKEDLVKIGLGFLGIVVFLGLLGLVLRLFNADVLNALPGLKTLFDSLIDLAKTIASFSTAQLEKIGLGFLGIVVFLGLLGLVLKLFNADVLNALPGLAQLFDSLMNMAKTIAGFSTGDMIQIGLGLLGIVIFLGLLSFAVNNFSVDALNALPALSQLLDTLSNLFTTIANFTPGQLITIGIAMLVIAGFMFLLAYALDIATPGLIALAEVLKAIEGIMDRVASAAKTLWDAISPILNSLPSLGDIFGSVTGSFTGGIAAAAGAAPAALAAPIPPPAPATAMAALPPSAVSFAGMPGALPSVGGPQAVDQSVHVAGITVNLNAERLEANAAHLLTDQIVQQLQEKLGALRAEQGFRTGSRPAATA